MIEEGKLVLFPITRNSIYLTIGTVVSFDSENNRVRVKCISTPAQVWTYSWVFLDEATKKPICPDPDVAKDCIGNPISEGDSVYYLDKNHIYSGTIDKIVNRLWVIVDDKMIRNVSIYTK